MFLRNERYYWCVRFPGDKKAKTVALKPLGSNRATKDIKVAKKVAKILWDRAVKEYDCSKNCSKGGRICDIVALYIEYANGYYCKNEAKNIEWALSYLNDSFGTIKPDEFGPKKLKELRSTLIKKRTKKSKKKSLCRKTINKIIDITRRCFKWAVSEELVCESTYTALMTVDGLKKNRSKAKETNKVTPIDMKHVHAIFPYTTNVISDMIQIQYLTAMRSGELVIMRPEDIVRNDDEWLYYPFKFKGDHLENKNRVVVIGPKAQTILAPYLLRDKSQYCFTPHESESQRLGHECTRKLNPRYNTKAFHHSVKKAIKRAQKEIDVEDWTPHRLRHTAATEIRANCDIETAKAVLGHEKISTTEIYAEKDLKAAISAVLRFG